jgi:hypothetical protein
MSDSGKPAISLNRARDRAVETLGTAFADDDLDVSEFEARVDRCYGASSLAELEAVFDDLPMRPDFTTPARAGTATGPGEGARTAPARRRPTRPVKEHDHAIAVMSGVRRAGRWAPPRTLHAIAVMGGAEIDLREAVFPGGVMTVNAIAIMGGVDIVVPPDVRVESSGIPLMGGFDRLDQDPGPEGHDDVVIRVRGMALMGGVEVRVAEPGEKL